jgi:hypothetical protein
MSTSKKLWITLIGVLLTMVIIACSCGTIIPGLTGSTPTASRPMPELEGSWQYSNKVYSIAWQNNQYEVTSVIDSEEGSLDVTSQSWDGNSLTWTYFRPSTGRSITYSTTSVNGNKLFINYSNDTGVLGSRILRRVSATQPSYDSLPIRDDFSDPNSGWDSYDNADGTVGYTNGSYFSIAKKQGIFATGYFPIFVGDSAIEADVTSVSGPSDNNFGYAIECHVRNNGNSYSFEITADGYYSVSKVTGTETYTYTSLLSGNEYQASDAINQGLATNHLVVTCSSNQLKLEVNGQTLFEGQDATFSEGGISLGAITYDTNNTPAEVDFDNLVVREP